MKRLLSEVKARVSVRGGIGVHYWQLVDGTRSENKVWEVGQNFVVLGQSQRGRKYPRSMRRQWLRECCIEISGWKEGGE